MKPYVVSPHRCLFVVIIEMRVTKCLCRKKKIFYYHQLPYLEFGSIMDSGFHCHTILIVKSIEREKSEYRSRQVNVILVPVNQSLRRSISDITWVVFKAVKCM